MISNEKRYNINEYSIVLYLIIAISIWIKKPDLLFNENGTVKEFGVGKNKTVFYYPILLVFLAIMIYILFYSYNQRRSFINIE